MNEETIPTPNSVTKKPLYNPPQRLDACSEYDEETLICPGLEEDLDLFPMSILRALKHVLGSRDGTPLYSGLRILSAGKGVIRTSEGYAITDDSIHHLESLNLPPIPTPNTGFSRSPWNPALETNVFSISGTREIRKHPNTSHRPAGTAAQPSCTAGEATPPNPFREGRFGFATAERFPAKIWCRWPTAWQTIRLKGSTPATLKLPCSPETEPTG